MADTLTTFQGAMGLIPDNSTRLVSPEDIRSAMLSLASDRGQANADPAQGPWVVPIPAANTWVDIPIAIGGGPAMVQGDALFWRLDANGHLVYNYAADWPTAVVPPGYERIVTLLGVVELDPNGNTYQFAFSIGGVIQLPYYTIETAAATDAITVPIISGDPIDVSAAPPVSMSVRNLDNAADLNMALFSMRVTGGVAA